MSDVTPKSYNAYVDVPLLKVNVSVQFEHQQEYRYNKESPCYYSIKLCPSSQIPTQVNTTQSQCWQRMSRKEQVGVANFKYEHKSKVTHPSSLRPLAVFGDTNQLKTCWVACCRNKLRTGSMCHSTLYPKYDAICLSKNDSAIHAHHRQVWLPTHVMLQTTLHKIAPGSYQHMQRQ